MTVSRRAGGSCSRSASAASKWSCASGKAHADAAARPARIERGGKGFVLVAGRGPVVREQAAARADRLELHGECLVQPPLLPREQTLGERLLQQRVADRVGVVDHSHEPAVDRRAEGIVQLLDAGDVGQHVVRDAAGREREHVECAHGLGGEPVERGEERVPKALWQALGAPVDVSGKLLDVERVPVGAPRDGLGHARSGLPAEQRGELRGDRIGPEAVQLDPDGVRAAADVRPALPRRDGDQGRRAPAGQDEQHARVVDRVDEEAQQVERRAVRPVQIVDDDEYRAFLRQARQELEHPVEQACARRLGESTGASASGPASSGTSSPSAARLPAAIRSSRSAGSARAPRLSASTSGR